MNFFFGINNQVFKSQLQIPLFKNRDNRPSKLNLFRCYPENNKWKFEKVQSSKSNGYFYIIKSNEISDKNMYFLDEDKKVSEFDDSKLNNYNKFTETVPAYRANLKIYIEGGGFSSYQSEYPFSMVNKTGSILSPICSLANLNADLNYLIIKNIFITPIEKKFSAYIVNYKSKKIEEEFELTTNTTNCIEIKKNLIQPDMFLVTRKYIGVPIYASIKDKYISFEHTHPPLEYILSKDKFVRVSKLKDEINDIIH